MILRSDIREVVM